MKKRNTKWTITASSPLLRPGLTISVEVSENYVVEEAIKLVRKVREVNLKSVVPKETKEEEHDN